MPLWLRWCGKGVNFRAQERKFKSQGAVVLLVAHGVQVEGLAVSRVAGSGCVCGGHGVSLISTPASWVKSYSSMPLPPRSNSA